MRSQTNHQFTLAPSTWGIAVALVAILLWVLGALSLGLSEPLRFILILPMQGMLHYLIGYYCIRFGQVVGYSNPIYLFWVAHSLHYLQIYGITNLIPICQPSKVGFADLGFIIVPDLLPAANLSVLLSYICSAYVFTMLLSRLSEKQRRLDIRELLRSAMVLIFGILAILIQFAASIRLGPLYNSTLGQQLLDSGRLYDTVSLPEKWFYSGTFIFTYVPILVLALYAILKPLSQRLGYILLIIPFAIIAIFSFSILRQRSYAMLSTVSALLPLIFIKGVKAFIIPLIPIITILIYFLVTSLRGDSINKLGADLDFSSFFGSANQDATLLADIAFNDASYNRAGLNSISVLIDFQEKGILHSKFGFQFISEFLAGFPEFIRLMVPDNFLTNTVEEVGIAVGQSGIDMPRNPYMAFVHDFHWLIAPLLYALIGFTLLYYLTLLMIKITHSFPSILGVLYIPYLSIIFLASSFSSYSVFLKVIFPWFILLMLVAFFTKNYRNLFNVH